MDFIIAAEEKRFWMVITRAPFRRSPGLFLDSVSMEFLLCDNSTVHAVHDNVTVSAGPADDVAQTGIRDSISIQIPLSSTSTQKKARILCSRSAWKTSILLHDQQD
ncbi:MAG: hypothetical protein JXR85_07990 [Deltaproteobacteria bacterium]|nr:hypothetical protein [Deltaproteobacteria bacterium]